MVDQDHLGLEWVVVDDMLRNVSDFAELPPNKRPLAFCPVCSQPVILKLGKVKAHHCAHQRGDECAATRRETIIHLNTKFHIAEQLKQARVLQIKEPCAIGGSVTFPCNKKSVRQWLENWDAVKVEFSIGTRRPDITLLNNGKPIGAIEVYVTNAVQDEKVDYLGQLGISWIEIKGHEEIYGGDNIWKSDQPLAATRSYPQENQWICKACRNQREKEIFRQNNGTHIHCVRIVDFFYPTPGKYRDLYKIMEERNQGKIVAVWLENNSGKISERISPVKPDSIEKLKKDVFQRDLDRKTKKGSDGAKFDSPMEWWSGEDANKVVSLGDLIYGNSYFQRRYVLIREENKWVMLKKYRDVAWGL